MNMLEQQHVVRTLVEEGGQPSLQVLLNLHNMGKYTTNTTSVDSIMATASY